MTKYIFMPLFCHDLSTFDGTVYNLCYKILGAIKHYPRHNNNPQKHFCYIDLLYFTYLTCYNGGQTTGMTSGNVLLFWP